MPAITTHSRVFTLFRALLRSTSLLRGHECASSFSSASWRCAFGRSLKLPRILEATHIPGFDPINQSQSIRSRIVPACGVSHLGPLTKMSSHENSEDLSKVEVYNFGPYNIHASEVFLATKHSFAFVNLKPVVPGHVLVSPRRVVPRFSDLVPEEVCDMWLTANRVGVKLEAYFKASSLTFSIQDGPAAGQTVPHVHIHILPRSTSDFQKNDEIYDVIDDKEKELAEHLDLDQERVNRTFEEMAAEASALRTLFSD